ncbi:MFS general substrate transporter [Daldinia caldariorum]|uniref:MFS general substrate transporter n=1 Tax=Daldinia caldariorum TaxID=326644 RepID=UPI002008463F|nr:MFS general substrate transporter [Daldinia caldariorum]KAI1467234.1 MFS general substrate transporter [Daldinia caldariorum]
MAMTQLPPSQQALQQDDNGQPYLVDKAAIPSLPPGYVLVKTYAVALNPSDHKILRNFPIPGAYLGSDFSGTVVQAAADVDTDALKLGTMVSGAAFNFSPTHRKANGAFAEYVRARADLLLRIAPPASPSPSPSINNPATMDPFQAATLATAICTCILAFWSPDALNLPGTPDAPEVREKPTPVLVYGGSTATGTIAIQLLRQSGYDPIATCSRRNFGLVRDRGASAALDRVAYEDGDGDLAAEIAARAGGRLRYALDCVSDARSAAVCYAAIQRPGGRYASLERVPEEILGARQAVRAAFVLAAEAYGEDVELEGGQRQARGQGQGRKQTGMAAVGGVFEADTAKAKTTGPDMDPPLQSNETDTEMDTGTPSPPPFKPNFRIYAIIAGLGITNLLAALENTVVSIAAPVILTDLQLGDNFIWVINAFFLSSTATQPLFGQFCNVFGRRYVMLTVVGLFMLGSGICGGASTGGMLIAGRAVQGVGSGGIIMVSSIIISDLVPLRRRGNYSAILMSIFGIGSALGPFIGGAIVSSTTWRWIFYMNLPIGGAAFAVLFVFLRVSYNKEMSFWQKLKRIDLVGNGILVASTVSVLYALSYAGTRYPWRSWHTLVPLLVGFLGLFIFAWLQTSGLSAEPLMPPRFFRTPTSVILAINTFLYAGLLYWCIFFLPVFFQGVLLYSPRRSGVAMLPISLLGIPGSIVGAVALARWGRYKLIHIVAFAIQTLGLGLFTLQWEETSVAQWAIFQCIVAVGGGMVFTTMLPAFQAFIHERDLAACTATWYFLRLFGHVWGVAIPAAIFNDRVSQLLTEGAVSNPQVAQIIGSGSAYQEASADFVYQFPPEIQTEIRAVYRQAIQRVFQISIVFSGVALILSLFEKEVKLRTTLDTEFGLEEKKDTE